MPFSLTGESEGVIRNVGVKTKNRRYNNTNINLNFEVYIVTTKVGVEINVKHQ